MKVARSPPARGRRAAARGMDTPPGGELAATLAAVKEAMDALAFAWTRAVMLGDLDTPLPVLEFVEGVCTVVDAGGAEPAVERVRLTPQSARHFATIMAVINLLHKRAVAGTLPCMQRDLFYTLKNRLVGEPWGEDGVTEQDVKKAVQKISRMLHVPREDLGVQCSGGKGLVHGKLTVWSDGTWTSCNLPDTPFVIGGDLHQIARMQFQTAARYVLVVEKETVFRRAVAERLDRTLPCLVVTGKGYPDHATRAFVHRLHAAFPRLKIFGLCDYNPDGVAILSTYRWGYAKDGSNAQCWGPRHAVPLAYLGVHAAHIADAGGHLPAGQALTGRDLSLLGTLAADSPVAGDAAWAGEVAAMADGNVKYEIEDVCYPNFLEFIVPRLNAALND